MNEVSSFSIHLEKLRNAGVGESLVVKASRLFETLSGYRSAVVAYSGGVDSTLLAYCTHLVLEQNMRAVLIRSSLESPDRLTEAEQTAEMLGIPFVVLDVDSLANPDIRTNPIDRCYHCKTMILIKIREYAREHGYSHVLEGQNTDDLGDYRPGRKAVHETDTRSPLLLSGLNKSEIRILSREFDLPTWNSPSSPCLATRIPYSIPLDAAVLTRIDQGEQLIRSLGYLDVRIRWGEESITVEVLPVDIPRLVAEADAIAVRLEDLGLPPMTIDPRGYRQGSLNEGIIP